MNQVIYTLSSQIKENMTNKRKGGWQFWVEDFGNYVIKTPKNKKEISDSVINWLRYINKLEEHDKRVNNMVCDLKNSTRLIKKSKIPLSILADLEFLDNGKIKQKKVIVLEEEFQKLIKQKNLKQAKKLIDQTIKLLIELWKYGLHEKTYKFYSNIGILNNNLFLIDPFELTGDKKKIEKQIKKKKWRNQVKYSKNSLKELSLYFEKKMNEEMTFKRLNKLWKQNLK
ncbi:MAG: hypothetical protein PVJ67_03255 [Candidatus Pacearchaeota archaeon]